MEFMQSNQKNVNTDMEIICKYFCYVESDIVSTWYPPPKHVKTVSFLPWKIFIHYIKSLYQKTPYRFYNYFIHSVHKG
jgi:hypothetical protein